jgi:hypothetical protein
LAVFHLLIGLACLTRDGFAKCVNEGMWGPKMIMVGIMFIGSFFIKNSFFISWSRWAMWISGVYLFVQMVSVIDAMYLWAEFWAKKFDDGNKCYGCLLIFCTLVMYTATGFVAFFSFKYFWIKGCFLNKVILISMVTFVLLFTVLIILKFHPKGSLITSSAISIYGCFLAWTAFLSFPNKSKDKTCNPIITERWSMLAQLSTSLFVGFICTFYWSVSGKASEVMAESGVDKLVDNEGDDKDQEEVELVNGGGEDDDGYGKNRRLIDTVQEGGENDYSAYEDNSYLKFHGFMMLYAVYLCPLFTNWGNTAYSGSGGGWNYGDQNSMAPYVIKLLIYVLSLLLYLWTIVAPQVLTNRSFE